jgi:hypothetical protein
MSGRTRTLWVVVGALCAAGVVVVVVAHHNAARRQERRQAVLEYIRRTIARKDVETLAWTQESRGKGVCRPLPDHDAHQAWELLTDDWAHVKEIDSSKAAAKIADFAGPSYSLAVRIRGSEGSLVEVLTYSRESGDVVVIFRVNDGPCVGIFCLENPVVRSRKIVKLESLIPAPNP